MTTHFPDLAASAAADGAIAPDEILALRQAGWNDGRFSPEEADALFAINDAVADNSREWTDFFIDALSAFVVFQTPPRGYVSDEQARWLMERIDRDGRLGTVTELELLVRIFEIAQSAPQALREYAMRRIEAAVLTGEGPTRDGALDPGGINAAEAQILRRILFSSGGDRPAAVSLAEAELLFRLKNASLGANNAPEWKKLFVQGVGNFLQGWQASPQLTRQRAAELEAAVADNQTDVGGFLRQVMSSNPLDGLRYIFEEQAERRAREARDRMAEAAAEEAVSSSEQQWLDREVGADCAVDEYEQALIDFLAEAG